MIVLHFSHTRNLPSSMLTLMSHCWCSHIDIEIDRQLISATPSEGVVIKEMDCKGINNNGRVAQIETYGVRVSRQVLNRAKAALYDQIGKPWDWTMFTKHMTHRIWDDPDKWSSSELVAFIFREGGMPLIRTEHLDRIYPRDVLLSPYLSTILKKGHSESEPPRGESSTNNATQPVERRGSQRVSTIGRMVCL